MRDMRRPESPTSAPAATAAPTLSSGWARTASVKLTLSIAAAKFRFASATVGLAGIRVVPLASRRGRGAAFLRKPFGKRVQPRRGEQRGRKQRGRGASEPRRDGGVEGEPAGKSRGEEQQPAEEKQEHALARISVCERSSRPSASTSSKKLSTAFVILFTESPGP